MKHKYFWPHPQGWSEECYFREGGAEVGITGGSEFQLQKLRQALGVLRSPRAPPPGGQRRTDSKEWGLLDKGGLSVSQSYTQPGMNYLVITLETFHPLLTQQLDWLNSTKALRKQEVVRG